MVPDTEWDNEVAPCTNMHTSCIRPSVVTPDPHEVPKAAPKAATGQGSACSHIEIWFACHRLSAGACCANER